MTEAWRPGDPVGGGEVYLPDEKTRAAYGEECARQIVEAYAWRVVQTPSLYYRRQLIEQFPKAMQQRLKDRVLELWRTSKDDAA